MKVVESGLRGLMCRRVWPLYHAFILGRVMAQSLVAGLSQRRSISVPSHSVLGLWWIKYHKNRDFFEYFGFHANYHFTNSLNSIIRFLSLYRPHWS